MVFERYVLRKILVLIFVLRINAVIETVSVVLRFSSAFSGIRVEREFAWADFCVVLTYESFKWNKKPLM